MQLLTSAQLILAMALLGMIGVVHADVGKQDEDHSSYQETVAFEAESVSLTQDAVGKLQSLVDNLDKSTPATVKVQVQENVAEIDVTGLPDAPADTVAAQELEREKRWMAKVLSEYRAQHIKEFLEDKGVEIGQWDVEALADSDQPTVRTALRDANSFQGIVINIVSDP